MLERLLKIGQELVIAHEILEESCQMFFRHIPAVGLWEKGQVIYFPFGAHVNTQPDLDPFQVEIKLSRIVLNIHQETAPRSVGCIEIVVVQGNKHGGMLFRHLHVVIFIFTDNEDRRNRGFR